MLGGLRNERSNNIIKTLTVAGKLNHSGADQLSGSDYSLVDYNRAGESKIRLFNAGNVAIAIACNCQIAL